MNAVRNPVAGRVVLQNIGHTSEGSHHHSMAADNESVQTTFNSLSGNKENVAPQGTASLANTEYKRSYLVEDPRVIALRLLQDFLFEYGNGPPRILGLRESGTHRFVIWNALEFIEMQQGCAVTLKQERDKFEKERDEFQRKLQKVREEKEMLEVQMSLLLGRASQQRLNTKRGREEISEPMETLAESEIRDDDSESGMENELGHVLKKMRGAP